jgi:hypothetical protein
MLCPYCGQTMEKGVLRSRGGVFFLPDGECSPLFYTAKQMQRHHAVPLPPDMYSVTAEFPTAYACRACAKLLIEYET